MRIKIRQADKQFSLYIRNRDEWKCNRCLKQYDEGSQGLHNSHFWSRGRESTRFDPENCDAMCFGCHQYLGSNPAEYTEWKRKQLGETKFNKLKLRAHWLAKKDDKAVLSWLKYTSSN